MRKQFVSVLLPAAALLVLNVGPVLGQSRGGSQSGKDTSVGGSQSERAGDSSTPVPEVIQPGTDKSPRGTGQSPRQSQSNKDTSVGGSQSQRAGDADTPAAPHGSGKSSTSQAPRTGQSDKDTSVGGTQSKRAGDSDTPAAPHTGSASRGSGNRSQASGMSGQQDIRQAQEALKAQGHDPGPIDGLMGPQTRQALREFQSSNGLQQTGTLDAETKDKLNIESSSNRGSGAMRRGDSSTGQKGSAPMGR